MTDKELRRLSKEDLIEIIYQLQMDKESWEMYRQSLLRKISDRHITMESSGSIAEAALALNKVFESAQNAADQYLESIKEEEKNKEKIILEAEKQGKKIIAKASKMAQEIIRSAEESSRAIKLNTDKEIREKWDAFEKAVKQYSEKYPYV